MIMIEKYKNSQKMSSNNGENIELNPLEKEYADTTFEYYAHLCKLLGLQIDIVKKLNNNRFPIDNLTEEDLREIVQQDAQLFDEILTLNLFAVSIDGMPFWNPIFRKRSGELKEVIDYQCLVFNMAVNVLDDK